MVDILAPNFTTLQLQIDRKSGDAALLSMTQNVAARLDVKTKKSAFYSSCVAVSTLIVSFPFFG